MNSSQTETHEQLVDSIKKNNFWTAPFFEILIHYIYLVLFLLINLYFGNTEFIVKYISSSLSEDAARNFYVAVLTTFCFIGAIFCISVSLSNKSYKLDFMNIQRIFSFGIDFLYFIMISAATMTSIVFVLTLYEDTPHLPIFFDFIILGLSSYLLKVVHFNFNLNIKSIKFHQ